jgi:signal transduction histidine kinase
MGQMIVRELLNLQGGRLEVQSQPGRGAVFRVLFPAA